MKSPCDITGAESQLPDIVRLISGCKAKPPEKRPAFCGHRVLREVKTDVLSECWCSHGFLNSDSLVGAEGRSRTPRSIDAAIISCEHTARIADYLIILWGKPGEDSWLKL
jgi:hypothetical protein